MEIVTDRTEYEILSILDRKNRAVDSGEIEKGLKKVGIEISRRRINQYFEVLDEKGFSENMGRDGRRITELGRNEVEKAFATVASTSFGYDLMRSLITQANFDINKKKGEVIGTISFIPEDKEKKVFEIAKNLCMKTPFIPPFIKIARSGEKIYDREIRRGEIGLAVISSVTLDEIILKSGIYVDPSYIGFIELKDYEPVRCVGLYSYQGVATDPFTLFIAGAKSKTYDTIANGSGVIMGDHRYVPYVARDEVIKVIKKHVNLFGNMVVVGSHSSELGLIRKEAYIGIFATGGELIQAALSAVGIPNRLAYTANAIIDFKEFEIVCEPHGKLIEL